MLRSEAVHSGGRIRSVRVGGLLLAATALLFSGTAVRGQSLTQLKDRMKEIQAKLDRAAARIEALEGRVHETEERIDAAERRKRELEAESRRLRIKVIERADELYRSGGTATFEALLASESFAELSDRAELLSKASLEDSALFVRLARSQEELGQVKKELTTRRDQLADSAKALSREADRLQREFTSVRAEYSTLKRKLAERTRREEVVSVAPSSTSSASSPALVFKKPRGNMACPVAGPVSFVDSWGAPRSGGRSHQGVDMMAAYGTPVVAIVTGTITFAGYGGMAGYWQILSGADGNDYWYLHNQRNLVTGGRVAAGRQIAEVGDTGNAEGTPHLHFEYHPGGGGAVNPYPLVASIC